MPTTLGAILLLLAVFACALGWASGGTTDTADHIDSTTTETGKTS